MPVGDDALSTSQAIHLSRDSSRPFTIGYVMMQHNMIRIFSSRCSLAHIVEYIDVDSIDTAIIHI